MQSRLQTFSSSSLIHSILHFFLLQDFLAFPAVAFFTVFCEHWGVSQAPPNQKLALRIVTVLWREEGYTMKYRLSPRDFPRAQAIFHRIPRLESQYSHSQSPLLANIFSYWGLLTSTSQYFLVLRPPDLRRPQYEKILASRGRSIVTVVFQYSIIWWLRMNFTLPV